MSVEISRESREVIENVGGASRARTDYLLVPNEEVVKKSIRLFKHFHASFARRLRAVKPR